MKVKVSKEIQIGEMKMEDKVWLTLNKKVYPKWVSYLSIVSAPFLCGVLVPIVIIGIIISTSFLYLISFGLLGLSTVCLIILNIHSDIKYGYHNALHTHYLQRREERINKVGANKT